MVIEFADPGIDWTPMWWSLGVLGVGILLFVLAFAVPEKYFQDWMPSPGAVIGLLGLVLTISALIAQPYNYTEYDIPKDTVTALEQVGYESVTLNGDRFTANDDGKFFSGVLVDLRPETGYAYQVLELTEADR